MDNVSVQLVLAAIAFASTDLDDLVLLIGFFADPRFRAWHVVLGQYLGIGALTAAGLAGSLVSLVIPASYIGLLGLVPVAIGAKMLWDIRGGAGAEGEADGRPPVSAGTHTAKVLTVAVVTVANGSDNLGVYIPLFATRGAAELAVFGLVFAAMTGLWCLIARWLVDHRALGAPLRRHGNLVASLVLIGLGLFILAEAGLR